MLIIRRSSVGQIAVKLKFLIPQSKKIIPEKKTRNLVKASGTVVLAFNVDIFV